MPQRGASGRWKERDVRQMGSRPASQISAMQRAHLMREIVETLLFVGLIFVIVHFTIQTYRVPDTSMQPALTQDELVVVNKAAYLFGGASRGDVVVLVDPANLSQQFVERVIAVPGDTVTITASQVIVNNVTLNESYINVPDGVAENPAIVAPSKLGKDEYWVMNDSRLASNDSRTFGPIARGNIIGQAVVVFWPLKEFHGVPTYSSVFSGVGK